jgi:hypothetical protein
MTIQVEVFRVVTPCNKYHGRTQAFRRAVMKMEAGSSSEAMLSYRNTTWRHNPEELDFLKFHIPTYPYVQYIVTNYTTRNPHNSARLLTWRGNIYLPNNDIF